MPKSKQRLAVNLRRLYVDCRYGQLHVHSAFPSSGGFDEQTTLIALHDAGETGRSLREFAGELGRDRSVYVPDLPGTGESDPSGRAVVIEDQVAALGGCRGRASPRGNCCRTGSRRSSSPTAWPAT